ncbi:hypothetical protein ACFQZQ_10905 [Lysobacter koreensis]|uniref:Uncharacterized protein n=1 Tax=Lysobacter koreensis TaxID=266122 RepID=A0ABW2YNL4_9GAMM
MAPIPDQAPASPPTIPASLLALLTAQTPAARATRAEIERWQRDWNAALANRLQQLSTQADARSQLAYALLLPLASGDADPAAMQAARRQALERAAQLDPDDVLVAWLQAVDCPGAQCDPNAALARLQRLEPDNAAVWLIELQAAHQRGDAAAVDRYLRLAAAADRYDLHFGDAGLAGYAEIAELPLPPLGQAERELFGQGMGWKRPASDVDLRVSQVAAVTSALLTPALQGLMQACGLRDGIGPPPARRAPCIAVLSHLAGSDTLIGPGMALPTLVQLTADGPEGGAWRERYRLHHWQYQQYSRGGLFMTGEQVLASWRLGEVPALQQRLQQLGLASPPPGWLPSNPYNRALVTSGRPPPRG